jgi:hypothetical protein
MKLYQSNVEFLRKWSADLRSGNYKQHRGCLVSDKNDAYCCIGVAEFFTCEKSDETATSSCVLRVPPHKFGNAWTLSSLSNQFLHEFPSFIDMNDSLNLTFPQIADVIDYIADNCEVVEG